MATKPKTEEVKEQKYHFFNDLYDLCLDNATEKEFINDVRAGGDDEECIYYRVPVELLEKIQVKSQIVTIK